MNRTFYYRTENQEYYSVGATVYHKTENGVREVITIDDNDNPKNAEALILYVYEFENHLVILLNWLIRKNIFCINKHTDEVQWRLPEPPNTWKTRTNYWTEIRADVNLYRDHVYCYTVDQYRCIYEVSTGKMVQEFYPGGGDPRDF